MNTRMITYAGLALLTVGAGSAFAFDEFGPKDVPWRPSAWELQAFIAKGHCDRTTAMNADVCTGRFGAPLETSAIGPVVVPTGRGGVRSMYTYPDADPREYGLGE